MAEEGIVLTDEDFCRVSRATLAYEAMPSSVEEETYLDTGNDGNWDDWVKVTGAVSGGWYPGIRQTYTESTDTWADVTGATCYIKGPNSETLTNGSRYRGNIVDVHSGSSAYQAVSGPAGAAGGSGITVKEVDGSPSQAGVTTLEVDQVTGGKVTVNTATDVTLSFLPASATQIGMINLSTQTLGDGDKTFSDSLHVTTNITVNTLFGVTASSGKVFCGSAALSPSGERFTIDHAGASGGGWRYVPVTNRTTAIADFYSGANIYPVVMCYDNGGTDIIIEIGVLESGAVRPAMKIFLDWTSGGYGYVEAKTRFQVNGTAGVTATQGVGQRCVFTGGICTGFV